MKFSSQTVIMMLLCGQRFVRAFTTTSSRSSTNPSLSSITVGSSLLQRQRFATLLSSSSTTASDDATTEEEEKESSSTTTEPEQPVPVQAQPDMEEIVSLCKRRGIIFPSSEIYNGYAGFFDYGPLGSELKKNLKDTWWNHFVTQREDVVGLDSSIIHNPTTWQSSGK
jgi:hypothetical protein